MVVTTERVSKNMPQKHPIRIDDLYKFRIPLEPNLSSAGQHVVFTVERMVTHDVYR
jgi:hypothetical protein